MRGLVRPRGYARLAVSVIAGFTGLVAVVATAPVWRLANPTWRLTLPGVPHPPSPFWAGAVFVAGVSLASLGWIGLVSVLPRLEARRGLLIASVVFCVWVVPVLLGPPLLSNDVYSYIAQGEMASRGIDPTQVGPVALGRGDFLYAVDPVWRTAPAPYGPLSILTSEGLVRLSGHEPSGAMWYFRGLYTLGVIAAGIGVVAIARTHRVPPGSALALAILNPLVLIYLIGGVHNDALMVGFLSLGLAAYCRDKRLLAVVLLTGAIAVKLPAALALATVAWAWAGPGASWRRRLRVAAVVFGGSAIVLATLCVLAGVGIGWITALKNTGKVMDTFSVMTILGYFASDLVHLAGVGRDNPEVMVAPIRMLGVVIGGVTAIWLITNVERLGVVRAVGLATFIMVVLSPVVWPWYLPAAFVLLAASGVGRYQPSYLVLVVSITFLVWPTSVPPFDWLLRFQRVASFFVILLIGGAAWAAQAIAHRRARSLGCANPLSAGTKAPVNGEWWGGRVAEAGLLDGPVECR
ncbi:MAG: polyprenol phosphomannose-dependent alpha 1,6 mannosyltransferase MptB [Acidimicrobiales bacterium]|nr:polyprenol phosphomannose-dependent alpha 1,6 mannosyltransferase MptB [Acidimicrobiales bacterium]